MSRPFVISKPLALACSAGGLVTAVAPVVINGNGLWVGWPGIHLQDPHEAIPESDPDDVTPTAGLKSDKVTRPPFGTRLHLRIAGGGGPDRPRRLRLVLQRLLQRHLLAAVPLDARQGQLHEGTLAVLHSGE